MPLTNSLKKYQDELLAAIMQPNSMKTQTNLESDHLENGHLEEELTAFDRVGLTIYQNNFFATAKRSLANSFPAVKALLEDNFDVAVSYYLQAHLKTNADWALIGEQFADYLGNETALKALPYLGDLAKFEYALFIAERASDKALVLESFSLLESADGEQIKMNFAPGFALLNSFYPIAELHSLLISEQSFEKDVEEGIDQAITALLEQPTQTHCFAIYRVGYQAKSLPLSENDYLAYEKFSSSASIGDAMEALELHFSENESEHTSNDEEFNLSHWLADAIKHQLLLGINEINPASNSTSGASNTS